MKRILPFLALLCLAGGKQQPTTGWIAYSNGKSVPVTRSVGDVVTLPIPPNAQTKMQCVSFLTESVQMNLTGRTLVVTVSVTGINPAFRSCYESGKCSFGPYFTTTTDTYDLRSANANQTQYWWGPRTVLAVGGSSVSIPLDPSLWTDSQGVSGLAEPEAFAAASSNVRQIGFSFGAHYFDTGAGMESGSATLHVQGFGVQ